MNSRVRTPAQHHHHREQDAANRGDQNKTFCISHLSIEGEMRSAGGTIELVNFASYGAHVGVDLAGRIVRGSKYITELIVSEPIKLSGQPLGVGDCESS